MALNIGSINFGITADIAQLQRAVQAIQQFGTVVDRAARSQAQGAQAQTAALSRQIDAQVRATNQAKALTDQLNRAGASAQQIDSVRASLERFVAATRGGVMSTLQLRSEQTRFNQEISNTTRALNQMVQAQRDSERVARASAQAQQAFQSSLNQTAKSLTTAQNQVDRFNAAAANRRDRGTGAIAGLQSQVGGAFQNLQGVLNNPAASTAQATAAMTNFSRVLTQAQLQLREYATAAQSGGRSTNVFGEALHRLGQMTVLTTGPLGGFSTRIQVLARFFSSDMTVALAATVAGVGLAVAAFIKLSEAVVRTERSLDTEGRVLTAINGSHTISELQLRKLMETADRTGTKFEELIGPYTKWLQTTKDTGIEGEKANLAFQQMATIAGVMHMPLERFTGAMDNMRRMMSSGTVQMRELRQRLETELPGASVIAAKALGVTIDQLHSTQKVGLGAQEFITKFLQAYVDNLGGVDQKVQGLTATEARWHNSLIKLWDAVDKVYGISTRYMSTLTTLTSYVNLLANNVNALQIAFSDLYKIIVGPDLGGLSRTLDALGDFALKIGNKEHNKWDPVGNFFRTLGEDAKVQSKNVAEFAKTSTEAQLAVKGYGSAVAGALPEIDEFIKSQKDAKFQTDPKVTDEYINKLEEEIEKRRQLVTEIENQAKATRDTVYHGFGQANVEDQNKKYAEQIKLVERYYGDIDKLTKQEQELIDLRSKPAGPAKFDPTEQPDFTKKLREYNDELFKYNSRLSQMGEGSEAFERWKNDVEALNNELARWREKLTDTATNKEIPGLAEKLNDLGDAFKKTKEYAQQLKEVMTPGQFALHMFDQMTNSASRFADAIVEGTLNMKTMGDIGKSMLKSLIADFIKLALLAPLKNALFGSHDQTFGMTAGGGPGIGGWLGSTFRTIMNPGAGFAIPAGAMGMAVTPGGFRYAGGGIFDTPTMFGSPRGPILGAEAGPEGILPLTRMRGGKLGVIAKFPNAGMESMPTAPATNVHFHGAPHGTRVEESTDANGGKRLDAFFSDMMAKAASTPGSSFQQGIRGIYGLRPATVRRGVA